MKVCDIQHYLAFLASVPLVCHAMVIVTDIDVVFRLVSHKGTKVTIVRTNIEEYHYIARYFKLTEGKSML